MHPGIRTFKAALKFPKKESDYHFNKYLDMPTIKVLNKNFYA